jgi:hypothetical protein
MLVSGTQSKIPGKEGERRIYGDHNVLFATETFIREQPVTIKAVLTALAYANDLIERNRSEASNILAKEFWFDTADMMNIMLENHYALAINDRLAGDFDHLTDFLYGLKSIQSKPDARAGSMLRICAPCVRSLLLSSEAKGSQQTRESEHNLESGAIRCDRLWPRRHRRVTPDR